jgi:RNA polymerase sigma factor (TIGR02999 family)
MSNPPDITRLLHQMQAGDETATPRLMAAVYPELKRIATRYLRAERPDHTLQATALVNEAYLQLIDQRGKDWHNRAHFFAVSAQVMRRILVDYARERKAWKRGAGAPKVELVENLVVVEEKLDEILAVDTALSRLSARDARQGKVVELRFFGGLTESEIALVLGIAPRTVKRDWAVAKAWLYGELNGGSSQREEETRE